MGGSAREGSKFVPGGGTFRDRNVDPMYEHPVMRYGEGGVAPASLGEAYGTATSDPQRVYDYEALKRLLELLNKDRKSKPHGVPDNANIGF